MQEALVEAIEMYREDESLACLIEYQQRSLPELRSTAKGYQMENDETNASKLIDKRIRELGDWRGKTLSKVRGIITEADPDIVRSGSG